MPHCDSADSALLYILTRIHVYTCNFIEISLGRSGVTEAQLRVLADTLASKHGRLQVITLDLSDNKLTNKCVTETVLYFTFLLESTFIHRSLHWT